MLSYYPNYCTNCSDLEEVLIKLDKKIAKQINKKWQQKKYLADTKFCKREYKNLLYYRRIALHLTYNAKYLGDDFDVSKFISKVKIITK